ncbi:MAG: hypothetical protein LBF24_00705 [Puniceicoccales bacterium]|nr:hypothetical protein [Puniceicoccales bacterium]
MSIKIRNDDPNVQVAVAHIKGSVSIPADLITGIVRTTLEVIERQGEQDRSRRVDDLLREASTALRTANRFFAELVGSGPRVFPPNGHHGDAPASSPYGSD